MANQTVVLGGGQAVSLSTGKFLPLNGASYDTSAITDPLDPRVAVV